MMPFRDSVAHLEATLARFDLLLRRHLEQYWIETERSIEEYQGLYVADETVESLLTPRSRGEPGGNGAHPATDQALEAQIEERTAALRRRERGHPREDASLRLIDLVDRFELTPLERDVLVAALAPDLDGKYGTIYAYLQDDASKHRPTTDFLCRVLCETAHDRLASRSVFAPDSPLCRWGLVHVEPATLARSERTVRVSERVLDFLLGSDAVAASLSETVTVHRPAVDLTCLDMDAAVRDRLSTLAAAVTAPDVTPPLVVVSGPPGAGKQAVVAGLATQLGVPLLSVTASSVLDSDSSLSLLALRRELALQGGALWVRDCDVEEKKPGADGHADSLHTLAARVDELDAPVFLTSRGSPPSDLHLTVTAHDSLTFDIPPPSFELRRAIWARVHDLPVDLEPADLASTFTFTPGQITDVVETARHLAGEEPVAARHVYTACRKQSGVHLANHASLVRPRYVWDDIKLPADQLAHLHEAADRIATGGRVYDSWGFGEKYTLGKGLTVLFAGPSGTGKTMAAEVIANAAGLDLYKIDLSQVVSKYIGETERNLGRIFDEAATIDAILLFDEADALFGKRSEVSDSHDRYANIEVNYLLQRIEEHDGTVILTTNLKRNIDEAFMRRLHLSIEFPRPDETLRAAIWADIFPSTTPTDDLDLEFLASLELTGGTIKNVALTAAFMAAADDAAVSMAHVVRALRREFQKTGQLLRPDEFGPYKTLLA